MEDVHRSNHEKCWMSGDILVITPTKMGDSCVANKIPMSSLKKSPCFAGQAPFLLVKSFFFTQPPILAGKILKFC